MASDNQQRLDHAAIWVEDMEKTVSFLVDVALMILSFHPQERSVVNSS